MGYGFPKSRRVADVMYLDGFIQIGFHADWCYVYGYKDKLGVRVNMCVCIQMLECDTSR